MDRRVESELLDDLAPDDPAAVKARRELRRVNAWMGNPRILAGALLRLPRDQQVKRMIDLGAGDGWLTLQLARRLAPRWPDVHVCLIDRQNLVTSAVRTGFSDLGWHLHVETADVSKWLSAAGDKPFDIVTANLFIHHFHEHQLKQLLAGIAVQSRCFVCCEPRRSKLALLFAHLVWIIGCNAVVRNDAVLSVRAGFNNHELTRLWPGTEEWDITEHASGLFSHTFMATRKNFQE